MNTRRYDGPVVVLLASLSIGILINQYRPSPPAELPPEPTPTLVFVVLPTATGVILAGPPTTKLPTPTWTPLPERLPMSTSTLVPPTVTPEPTSTPDRPAVQKG